MEKRKQFSIKHFFNIPIPSKRKKTDNTQADPEPCTSRDDGVATRPTPSTATLSRDDDVATRPTTRPTTTSFTPESQLDDSFDFNTSAIDRSLLGDSGSDSDLELGTLPSTPRLCQQTQQLSRHTLPRRHAAHNRSGTVDEGDTSDTDATEAPAGPVGDHRNTVDEGDTSDTDTDTTEASAGPVDAHTNLLTPPNDMAAPPLTDSTLIGEGTFGKVYRLWDPQTGREVAVKAFKSASNHSVEVEQGLISLRNEIKLLRGCDHERIVRYIRTEEPEYTFYLYMEYMPGGSIRTQLNEGAFNEAMTKKYTKQILEGLCYLHDKGIIHRDVKGANTLLDGEGNIKLADFGLAKQMNHIQTSSGNSSMTGTLNWMSPQVISGAKYGRRADIWSTGATVKEMMTTLPPWTNLGTLDVISKITALTEADYEEYFLDPAIGSEARAFLALTFKPQEADRPRAEELLANPWLQTE